MDSGPLVLHRIYSFAAPKPWPCMGKMKTQPIGLELGKILVKHAGLADAHVSQHTLGRKRKLPALVEDQTQEATPQGKRERLDDDAVSGPEPAKRAREASRFSTTQLKRKLGDKAPENAKREQLLEMLVNV